MGTLALGISDDGFWSDPGPALQAAGETALNQGFRGMHLEGPSRVDIAARRTLPLLGIRSAAIRDNFPLRHETHAVLAAVDSRSHAVIAAPAWENKSEEKEDLTPPAEGFPKGTTVSPLILDARARLPGLRWGPGSYSFILFLFDRRSNPVPVRLEIPKQASDAPTRSDTVSGDAGPPAPIASLGVFPEPGKPGSHGFAPSPSSPALPDGTAISIQAASAPSVSGKAGLRVRGSFRANPLKQERMAPDAASRPKAGPADAAAIVSVTVLALGDGVTGPFLFPLRVPAKTGAVDGTVEGFFDIDLAALGQPFGLPQKYAVWAICGESVSEPEVVSLTP